MTDKTSQGRIPGLLLDEVVRGSLTRFVSPGQVVQKQREQEELVALRKRVAELEWKAEILQSYVEDVAMRGSSKARAVILKVAAERSS